MFKKSELLVLVWFLHDFSLLFNLYSGKKGIMFRIQIQLKDVSLERHFSLLSLSKAYEVFARLSF